MSVINDVREYYTSLIDNVAPSLTQETTKVVSTSAREWKSRIKVLPRETIQAGIGQVRLQEFGGLVTIDVIAPRSATLRELEDMADSIINAIPTNSQVITPKAQLITYTVWQEALREEETYTILPIWIRWEALSQK